MYDIALETISHGDGLVDAHRLSRFVAAYQTVSPLKLGELWAIPIMLRLALIENLRRVGVRMAAARADRDLASVWADQMMETAENDPKSLILVIADMARSSPPMGSAFVAELTRRLQGQSAGLALALTWIEQQLAESHLTIDQLVQLEAQLQASHQVSISNSIGSLRLLSAIDWREFVEQMSVVEKILREDPSGVHADMEFATRDSYRHATEQIARRSALSEGEVAAKAIELARARANSSASLATAAVAEAPQREAHVGYYLIDRGLARTAGSGRCAALRARDVAPVRTQASARALPRLDCGHYSNADRRADLPRLSELRPECKQRVACGSGPDRSRVPAGDQPTGGVNRQLACHAMVNATAATAYGLQRRHRCRRTHSGCGPDAADRCGQRGEPDRGARGAVPRES